MNKIRFGGVAVLALALLVSAFQAPKASAQGALMNPYHMFPASDAGMDLGTTSFRWRDFYLSRNFLASSGKILISGTAPTISSGFGTTPSISSNNGTGAFQVTIGNPTGSSGVIGLPTATTGWRCNADDLTTQSATVYLTKQTASSTSSATMGNFDAAGAAQNWVAADVLVVSCMAF